MKLIIGLGNPGEEYRFSRHNFGHIVIDMLSERWKIPLSKEGDFSLYGEGIFREEKVILIKPLTYMNCSGAAASEWFSKVAVDPNTVIIIHDDLDLPEGDVRMKRGGGHGGHRGLMSVIGETGCSDFARLRIGTGRPPGRERDREAIVEWLLSPLTEQDLNRLKPAFEKAIRCIEDFVLCGIDRAMEKCNTRQKTYSTPIKEV